MNGSSVGRLAVLAAVAAAAMAGCAGGGGTGQSTTGGPTSPSAVTGSSTTSATPDPSASAATAALSAYSSYRAAFQAALKAGKPTDVTLRRYAADKALAEAEAELLELSRLGIVYKGTQTGSPAAGSVDLDATRPTVVVTDCLDNTRWIPVYKATGKTAAAPGQNLRVPATASVQFFNGAWVVMTSRVDRSRSC